MTEADTRIEPTVIRLRWSDDAAAVAILIPGAMTLPEAVAAAFTYALVVADDRAPRTRLPLVSVEVSR